MHDRVKTLAAHIAAGVAAFVCVAGTAHMALTARIDVQESWADSIVKPASDPQPYLGPVCDCGVPLAEEPACEIAAHVPTDILAHLSRSQMDAYRRAGLEASINSWSAYIWVDPSGAVTWDVLVSVPDGTYPFAHEYRPDVATPIYLQDLRTISPHCAPPGSYHVQCIGPNPTGCRSVRAVKMELR